MYTMVAFLIAPIVGVLVAGVLVLPWVGEFGALGYYLLFGAFFAYPTALLIGLPLYLAIKRLVGGLRLWHYALGGFIASVPSLYFVLAPENAEYLARTWKLNSALCLLTGVAAGLAVGIVVGLGEKKAGRIRAL